jgi:hypothetical protein
MIRHSRSSWTPPAQSSHPATDRRRWAWLGSRCRKKEVLRCAMKSQLFGNRLPKTTGADCAECSGDLLPPAPPVEKATARQGDPAAAAHSMRASAQVTAPGAATSRVVAVSTRPNKQNRSTCSRMSLSTKAKVEGGKSVTRPAEPKPTSWPLRWSTPSRRQIRT